MELHLILVVATFVIAETLAFEKFGCTYQDESDYQISTDSGSHSVFKPIFSEKEVVPMKFNSTGFQEMIRGIESIYKEFLKKHIYNDLTEFIEFYDARKTYNGKFEDFYKQYIPRLLPNKTSLSLSIRLLEEIATKYKTEEHSYLVISAVPETENSIECGEDLRKFNYMIYRYTNKLNHCLKDRPPAEENFSLFSHVAAVIQFEVEYKKGVVLLDIVGLKQPVIVWANGDQTSALSFNNLVQEYIFHDEVPNGFHPITSSLYYVGKPYCSALISTCKRRLLMNDQWRIRRLNWKPSDKSGTISQENNIDQIYTEDYTAMKAAEARKDVFRDKSFFKEIYDCRRDMKSVAYVNGAPRIFYKL